jgi:hypothetical protein
LCGLLLRPAKMAIVKEDWQSVSQGDVLHGLQGHFFESLFPYINLSDGA